MAFDEWEALPEKQRGPCPKGFLAMMWLAMKPHNSKPPKNVLALHKFLGCNEEEQKQAQEKSARQIASPALKMIVDFCDDIEKLEELKFQARKCNTTHPNLTLHKKQRYYTM